MRGLRSRVNERYEGVKTLASQHYETLKNEMKYRYEVYQRLFKDFQDFVILMICLCQKCALGLRDCVIAYTVEKMMDKDTFHLPGMEQMWSENASDEEDEKSDWEVVEGSDDPDDLPTEDEVEIREPDSWFMSRLWKRSAGQVVKKTPQPQPEVQPEQPVVPEVPVSKWKAFVASFTKAVQSVEEDVHQELGSSEIEVVEQEVEPPRANFWEGFGRPSASVTAAVQKKEQEVKEKIEQARFEKLFTFFGTKPQSEEAVPEPVTTEKVVVEEKIEEVAAANVTSDDCTWFSWFSNKSCPTKEENSEIEAEEANSDDEESDDEYEEAPLWEQEHRNSRRCSSKRLSICKSKICVLMFHFVAILCCLVNDYDGPFFEDELCPDYPFPFFDRIHPEEVQSNFSAKLRLQATELYGDDHYVHNSSKEQLNYVYNNATCHFGVHIFQEMNQFLEGNGTVVEEEVIEEKERASFDDIHPVPFQAAYRSLDFAESRAARWKAIQAEWKAAMQQLPEVTVNSDKLKAPEENFVNFILRGSVTAPAQVEKARINTTASKAEVSSVDQHVKRQMVEASHKFNTKVQIHDLKTRMLKDTQSFLADSKKKREAEDARGNYFENLKKGMYLMDLAPRMLVEMKERSRGFFPQMEPSLYKSIQPKRREQPEGQIIPITAQHGFSRREIEATKRLMNTSPTTSINGKNGFTRREVEVAKYVGQQCKYTWRKKEQDHDNYEKTHCRAPNAMELFYNAFLAPSPLFMEELKRGIRVASDVMKPMMKPEMKKVEVRENPFL